MWFIGVEVDKRRVHPLLKKILDPPLHRELINEYLKFYSSALSLLKNITVVLKVLPSFRDFFSYQLTEIQLCYFFSCLLLFEPLRAKFESCMS